MLYRAGNVGYCISGMTMPVSISSSYSKIGYNLFVVRVVCRYSTYGRKYLLDNWTVWTVNFTRIFILPDRKIWQQSNTYLRKNSCRPHTDRCKNPLAIFLQGLYPNYKKAYPKETKMFKLTIISIYQRVIMLNERDEAMGCQRRREIVIKLPE